MTPCCGTRSSGKITNIALTYQRDIFCSGTSVLSDGRVFIAGGHIYQGALNAPRA